MSKVKVYSNEDDSEAELLPVDAKEAVALGTYRYGDEGPPAIVPEFVHAPEESEAEPIKEALPDLESMTKAQLEEYAGEHNISVTSSMTKAEQIEAIRAGS